MGKMMFLSCNNCNCRKEMAVGGGMMTNFPDVIVSCLNQEDVKEWQRLYDSNLIRDFQAEQKVFYCDNCKDLYCNLSVDVELTDGKKITLGNKCEICHNVLWEIKLQDNMECPICKSGKITWKQTGVWD